jgi:hypothetical protein
MYSTYDDSDNFQKVSNHEGSIPNATKIKAATEYNDPEPEIPDAGSASTSNYSAGNYPSSGSSLQGGSYGTVQPQSYQNANSQGSGGGSGQFIASGGGSRSSDASSGFSMTNVSTQTTTTNLSNSGTKQSATAYTANTGATDPGPDPLGNPIPVGDGWGVFVLFGAIYALLKNRSFHRTVFNKKQV